MKSSPYGLYNLGYTRATMIRAVSYTKKRFGVNPLNAFVFGLLTETRQYKAGITSNRRLERYGEFVLRSCTHRPSHARSEFCLTFFLVF